MFKFEQNSASEEEIQRSYYRQTAQNYDQFHLHEKDVHYFALTFMLGAIGFLDAQSVLDVGAGTGRTVSYINQRCPSIRIKGVEPVKELREIGYSKGISEKDLIEGNGLSLDFEDNSFDIVCCFGILHHIKTPRLVIEEMLRVSKKAIFISDGNNFGQGTFLSRTLKQSFNFLGLWPLADFIKTKGKGYTISEGDGLAYSYSVFNDFNYIRRNCKTVHLLNTSNTKGANLYKNSDSIALLGIK
ncbi:class I SAM-dependent methyltransferase [Geminocystis sp. NIES-3709]|uniref:class I SAM-dependent methyltransferase n=1 Tax=Geminocystis sp. NIES-3709 TaxID=1617448 RepID=UPI0005FC87A8|nr:class I SAM-dependent methyltransferase [Geminocystis sp. NIES-3709]BAQ66454.1 5-carboxymethyl uridine and 5-carboxymethyl 2-thiouridine methyltransferase [Geminocystis sp. NIES-3709]